jgi:hypothetical protein
VADRAREALADGADVPGEGRKPLIELLAERMHLTRVLRDRLLMPARGDRAQEGDQRRRRGGNHLRLPRVLVQPWIVVVRDAEERLVRQEHDDEVRRGRELAPVRLRRQLADVVAYLSRVAREQAGAVVPVVRRVGVEVRVRRHLRVDHDLLAAGQLDDEVGPEQRPFAVAHRDLRDEVAVLDHARQLYDPTQLHLAPAAALMRGAQGVRQPRGAIAEQRDLLRERAERPLPRLLEVLNVAVHLLERLLQRRDVPGKLRLGEREKGGVALLERVGRKGLHRRGEPLVGRAPLDVQLRQGGRELLLVETERPDRLVALHEPRAHGQQHAASAGEETDDHRDDRHEGQSP